MMTLQRALVLQTCQTQWVPFLLRVLYLREGDALKLVVSMKPFRELFRVLLKTDVRARVRIDTGLQQPIWRCQLLDLLWSRIGDTSIEFLPRSLINCLIVVFSSIERWVVLPQFCLNCMGDYVSVMERYFKHLLSLPALQDKKKKGSSFEAALKAADTGAGFVALLSCTKLQRLNSLAWKVFVYHVQSLSIESVGALLDRYNYALPLRYVTFLLTELATADGTCDHFLLFVCFLLAFFFTTISFI